MGYMATQAREKASRIWAGLSDARKRSFAQMSVASAAAEVALAYPHIFPETGGPIFDQTVYLVQEWSRECAR